MSIDKIIISGFEYAQKDYIAIATAGTFDVKPKEDQIKCALYRAFSENNYLVHVEAKDFKKAKRCDLIVSNNSTKRKTAIEIKTAWAGDNKWNNKPPEQAESWQSDINKLISLKESDCVHSCYFILCFAYQNQSNGEEQLRKQIKKYKLKSRSPFEINAWNSLNNIQFFSLKVC